MYRHLKECLPAIGSLFLTAGTGPGDFGGDSLTDTEILQLSYPPPHPDTKPCPVKPADFPTITGQSSGTFIGGRPINCGGSNLQQTCREFIAKENVWEEPEFQLNVPRSPGGGVRVSEDQWWLTGGNGFTDLYTEGAGFALSTEKPEPLTGSYSLTRVTDTQVIMTGGRILPSSNNLSNQTWLYDFFLEEWARLPDFQLARKEHMTGLVQGTDGSKYLVLTGGYDEDYNSTLSTEVYSLANQTWSAGPDLPQTVRRAETLPYEWSFLMVGGFLNNTMSDRILYFDPVVFDWVILPDRLSTPRTSFVSMIVPLDFCQEIQDIEKSKLQEGWGRVASLFVITMWWKSSRIR